MKLKGLLLCGGRSSRLGLDKSLLEIDGQQVYNRWIEYFTSFQINLYISCKPEQVSNYNHHLIIVDKHDQLGPLSGLVAAIHNDASCHWFIVSVDLLYITKNDINYLLSKYKKEYFACCFQDAHSIIYPLFSLISPSMHTYIQEHLLLPNPSIKKILSHPNVQKLHALFDNSLVSINTSMDLKNYLHFLDQIQGE